MKLLQIVRYGVVVTFTLLIVLRISFERIDMVITFVAAPACKIKACGTVKAAAVHKDFMFSCFEEIEILALVVAQVEDRRRDILLVYSDLFERIINIVHFCRVVLNRVECQPLFRNNRERQACCIGRNSY